MDAKIVKFSVITRIVVPDGLDEDNIAMFAMDKIAENPLDYLTIENLETIEDDEECPFDEETDEIYALDADNHIIKKGDIVNYLDIEKQGVSELEEDLDIEWEIDEVFPDGETCLISCKEGMQAEVPSIELAKTHVPFYNQNEDVLEATNDFIKKEYDKHLEENNGETPKYAYVEIEWLDDNEREDVWIQLRDIPEDTSKDKEDDTITYYCTNGVEEMLEINTNQTADFVITELFLFTNQLF